MCCGFRKRPRYRMAQPAPNAQPRWAAWLSQSWNNGHITSFTFRDRGRVNWTRRGWRTRGFFQFLLVANELAGERPTCPNVISSSARLGWRRRKPLRLGRPARRCPLESAGPTAAALSLQLLARCKVVRVRRCGTCGRCHGEPCCRS